MFKRMRGFRFGLILVVQLILIVGCSFCGKSETIAKDFILVKSISDLKAYANKDNINIKLEPGNYQIADAENIRFLKFTGNNCHFDLRGVRFMVDVNLFSRTDLAVSNDGNTMYCAIEIAGNHVVFEGLYIETYGDKPGKQSKNKIFNIVGSDVSLKNVEIRTAGSSPWGYGYLYGISQNNIVRKMNGIRVGYPAKNVKVIGCQVHMRAMGHAIFIQGAENTLVEDCQVDGLLRTTDEILAEKSGFCFDKKYHAHKGGYIEGTMVGDDGKILPGEIISLSEDGIRVYTAYKDHPTINTTIKDCTVFQMRRGICTGLNSTGDKVINCRSVNCVATGFNVGHNDTLINCFADAKYAEAFCAPYLDAENAYVEMEILDSRNGMANNLLAKINGTAHQIEIKTSNPRFIPEDFVIKLSTYEGYGGPWDKRPTHATNINLNNYTQAKVILLTGTIHDNVNSQDVVNNKSKNIRID